MLTWLCALPCRYVNMLTVEGYKARRYAAFYIASLIIVGIFWLLGLWFVFRDVESISDGISPPQLIFEITFIGLRTYDLMSDWAFFALVLREGGRFDVEYTDEGGNFEAVWTSSLVFCIIGSITWCVDLKVNFNDYQAKTSDNTAERSFRDLTLAGIAVVVLEDGPQFVLQCIYWGTIGYGSMGEDAVAVVCFVTSIASILCE